MTGAEYALIVGFFLLLLVAGALAMEYFFGPDPDLDEPWQP